MEQVFKKGDYVDCDYDGKICKGCLMTNPKNGIVKVNVLVSPKRSEPIFEEITISVNNIKSLIK